MLTPTQSAELTELAESRWGPKRHWSCIYCGNGAGLTVDHFQPRQAGGSDDLVNLVPACDRCQQSKSDRPPVAWMVAAGVPEDRIIRIIRVTGDPGFTVPQQPDWLTPRMPEVRPTVLDYVAGRRVPRLSSRTDSPAGTPDTTNLPSIFELDPAAWTPRTSLLAAARELRPDLTPQVFYRDLARRGFPSHKRNGVVGFRGIRLTEPSDLTQ